jgi:hypothetical protein
VENGKYFIREFENLTISADGKTCTAVCLDSRWMDTLPRYGYVTNHIETVYNPDKNENLDYVTFWNGKENTEIQAKHQFTGVLSKGDFFSYRLEYREDGSLRLADIVADVGTNAAVTECTGYDGTSLFTYRETPLIGVLRNNSWGVLCMRLKITPTTSVQNVAVSISYRNKVSGYGSGITYYAKVGTAWPSYGETSGVSKTITASSGTMSFSIALSAATSSPFYVYIWGADPSETYPERDCDVLSVNSLSCTRTTPDPEPDPDIPTETDTELYVKISSGWVKVKELYAKTSSGWVQTKGLYAKTGSSTWDEA